MALLLNNVSAGPAIKYLGESPHSLLSPWEISEYDTPHGLMHHHWFGFFKHEVNTDNYGADLLISLWDVLRDLNRQPISVLLEYAELQSVMTGSSAGPIATLQKHGIKGRVATVSSFRRDDSSAQAPF